MNDKILQIQQFMEKIILFKMTLYDLVSNSISFSFNNDDYEDDFYDKVKDYYKLMTEEEKQEQKDLFFYKEDEVDDVDVIREMRDSFMGDKMLGDCLEINIEFYNYLNFQVSPSNFNNVINELEQDFIFLSRNVNTFIIQNDFNDLKNHLNTFSSFFNRLEYADIKDDEEAILFFIDSEYISYEFTENKQQKIEFSIEYDLKDIMSILFNLELFLHRIIFDVENNY